MVLKNTIAKNFVANKHHSFTLMLTFSVVNVDLPIHCILSFLFPEYFFPAETGVLVPVFSQAIDVVVVNLGQITKCFSAVRIWSLSVEKVKKELHTIKVS